MLRGKSGLLAELVGFFCLAYQGEGDPEDEEQDSDGRVEET